MCGRYTLTKGASGICPELVTRPIHFGPRYNIAPGQDVPVVLGSPVPNVQIMRWGLVPSWAQDPSIASRLINARAETLAKKPSFRDAFQKGRCLVPADGFFEWKKEGSRSVPYRFILRGERPFAFAGLCDSWMQPDGTLLRTFTIVTTQANPLVHQVHPRMPVILPAAAYAQWLDPAAAIDSLQSSLQPFPAHEMDSGPVNPVVNDYRCDDPRCTEPSPQLGLW